MARGEFGEDHLEPAAGLGIEAEFVVSAAQVLNERMSATDLLGATLPLQTAHRTSPGVQPAVISFNRGPRSTQQSRLSWADGGECCLTEVF